MRESAKKVATAVTGLLLVGLAAVVSPAGAAEREQDPARLYDLDVEGIDREDAERLLIQKCYESDWKCSTKWSSGDWLTVWAPPAAHEWFAARIAEWDVPPPTLVFRLYLLRARAGSGDLPRLAPAAAAALEDLIEFLPPSSFELWGTSVVSLQPDERAQTMLAGSEGFRAHMKFAMNGSPRRIRVYFSLVDRIPVTDDKGARAIRNVEVLDNAFGMEVGETVVVGTSEAGRAGESLIVLLSADPS
jgi:hypothetical protein